MIELSFTLVLLLLAAGVVLMALEVFLTPGLGVKGVLGLVAVIAAVVLAYAQHGPLEGTLVLGGAVAVIVGGGWVASRTVGRRLVLNASLPPDPGEEIVLGDLLGAEGVAISHLRPVGVARFGERRLDVTSEPEYLDAGTRVVVVSIAGNKIKVERAA